MRSLSQTHQASTHVVRTAMAPYWSRRGDCGYTTRKRSHMRPKRKVMAMGIRPKWVGIPVMLALLLCIGAVPGYTDRGGHGFRGHGWKGHGFKGHAFRGHWHRGPGFRHGFHHGFRGPRVRIGIGLGTFWGPYWGWRPYWPTYAYPPVVVAPPPVVIRPSPQYWYYCDNRQGYYPYVPQCPRGWRPVTPTPP
jgi:hypothetical protein